MTMGIVGGAGFIGMPLSELSPPPVECPNVSTTRPLKQRKAERRSRMGQPDVSHSCSIVTTRNSSILPGLAARPTKPTHARVDFGERTSRRPFSPHFRRFFPPEAAVLI